MTRSVVVIAVLACLLFAAGSLPVCGSGACGMPCCKTDDPNALVLNEAGCCQLAPVADCASPAETSIRWTRTTRSHRTPADCLTSVAAFVPSHSGESREVRETCFPIAAVPLFILNASLLI
jgi:hypothetical protein